MGSFAPNRTFRRGGDCQNGRIGFVSSERRPCQNDRAGSVWWDRASRRRGGSGFVVILSSSPGPLRAGRSGGRWTGRSSASGSGRTEIIRLGHRPGADRPAPVNLSVELPRSGAATLRQDEACHRIGPTQITLEAFLANGLRTGRIGAMRGDVSTGPGLHRSAGRGPSSRILPSPCPSRTVAAPGLPFPARGKVAGPARPGR